MVFSAEQLTQPVSLQWWAVTVPLAIAAITAVTGIITAIIANRTKKSVGKSNGQGDLVAMNERQLKQHAEVMSMVSAQAQDTKYLTQRMDFFQELLLNVLINSQSPGGSVRSTITEYQSQQR